MNYAGKGIDQGLYIELLQEEVKRLRMQVETLEMRYKMREYERERANQKPAHRQGAVVAGMMGVTPSKAAEAMAEAEYNPPRNLGDGPVEDLMAKTRADLKGEQDAD